MLVADHPPAPAEVIAGRVLARALAAARPQTRLDFSRRVKHVAGDLVGHGYNPDSDPIQRWLIGELDRGVWERVYWSGPPQFSGKTIVAILQPILYGVIQQKLPIGYALPTLQDLDKAWHTKLRPQLLLSGFGAHLPQQGPGSKGGRGPSVQFRDPETQDLEGQLIFCAGGAYGDTVAAMLVDEIDQFRKDGKPDLGALDDLWNRCNAYRSRAVRIAVGTVEWDDDSTILTLISQGTDSRPWLRCPHCGAHQLVDPEKQLRYEGDDDATVRGSAALVCAVNGCHWSEDDRQQAITEMVMAHRGQVVTARGAIEGAAPKTIALSLLETAYDCPHARLPELAREHWLAKKAEAKGQYIPMRRYTRMRLIRGYVQPVIAGELSNRTLADLSKASTYHRREVPRWVQRIVVCCDVQKDRHYWLALGLGPDGRWCIVAWGFEFLVALDDHGNALREPTEADRVRVMDAIDAEVMQGWPIQGDPDRRLAPTACGIDTGYKAKEIVAWVITKPHWCPLKGVGRTEDGRKDDQRLDGKTLLEPALRERLLGFVDVSQPTTMTTPLWHVNGSNVRSLLHSGLKRAVDSPGSGLIPREIASNDMLVLHLTAELWTKDEKTGKWYWRAARPGNHLLDCATYALALALYEAAVEELYPAAPPAPAAAAPAPTADEHRRLLPASPQTTPDGRPLHLSDR